MNTPNNPPPPEAVEAAMKWASGVPICGAESIALTSYGPKARGRGYTNHAAYILVAEVRRLRAECERLKHERNRAGMEARKEMLECIRGQTNSLDHILMDDGETVATERVVVKSKGKPKSVMVLNSLGVCAFDRHGDQIPEINSGSLPVLLAQHAEKHGWDLDGCRVETSHGYLTMVRMPEGAWNWRCS